MEKQINISLIPDLDLLKIKEAEEEEKRNDSGICTASKMREAYEWSEHILHVKWDAVNKSFTVHFLGVGKLDLSRENILSKEVPLKIAQSSRCECGQTLELGSYEIISKTNDFSFLGTFFCPNCKSKFEAEESGFRWIFNKWVKGLKKIEIKVDGVGLERD